MHSPERYADTFEGPLDPQTSATAALDVKTFQAMDTFHKSFLELIERELPLERMILYYVKKELEKRGLQLESKHEPVLLEAFKQAIESDQLSFELDIEDSDIENQGKSTQELESAFSEILNFTDETIKELSNLTEELIGKLLISSIDEIAPEIYKDLLEDEEGFKASRLDGHESIEDQIERKWGILTKKVGMMLAIATEIHIDVMNKGHRGNDTIEEEKVHLMGRLFARVCQVSEETLVLIKSGYADGALSRWRTLHELTVLIALIARNDFSLTQRYLDHSVIENHKEMLSYNEYSEIFGTEPIKEDEIERSKNIKLQIVKQYGSSFEKEYGWARTLIDKDRITFRDLEQKAALQKNRHYYKLASYNTHAGVSGILYKISFDPQKIVILGPSVRGVEFPLQLLSESLVICAAETIARFPMVDHLVGLKIITIIGKEIREQLTSN